MASKYFWNFKTVRFSAKAFFFSEPAEAESPWELSLIKKRSLIEKLPLQNERLPPIPQIFLKACRRQNEKQAEGKCNTIYFLA